MLDIRNKNKPPNRYTEKADFYIQPSVTLSLIERMREKVIFFNF